jgi:hypothetical protein
LGAAFDPIFLENEAMKLITGDKLPQAARAEVLRAFIYRPTTENGYPKRNPRGARVAAVTDAEWLKTHAFYVTNAGKLAKNRNHAVPARLAD